MDERLPLKTTEQINLDAVTRGIEDLNNGKIEYIHEVAKAARDLTNARHKLSAAERGGESTQAQDRIKQLIHIRSERLARIIIEVNNMIDP